MPETPVSPVMVDALLMQLEMVSRAMGNGVPKKVQESFSVFLTDMRDWSKELKGKASVNNAAKSA